MEIWIWPCSLFSSYEGILQSSGDGLKDLPSHLYPSLPTCAMSLRKLGPAAGHAAGSGQADVADISGQLGHKHRELLASKG